MVNFDNLKKQSMTRNYWSLLLVFFCFISSCKLREDLQKINTTPKDHSVRVAIPVIDSRLTMNQLLTAADSLAGTSEYVNIDDDGKITLVYRQDIEIPEFASIGDLEIEDVVMPTISENISQDMPEIPAINIDAGSITIREVIGDDVLADNIDLIGVVGQPINKTVAKSLDDLTQTQTIDYGYFCFSDTQEVFNQEVITEHCTDTMSQNTIELLGLNTVGLGDGRVPCLDDQDYQCIAVDTQVLYSMTLREAIENDVITQGEIESELGGTIIGDSIYVGVDTIIDPLAAQSIGAQEQYRENIPLDGFNFITLEDGRIVMTIRNHFPFDLTNVEFEVRTGTFDENELLGTFSFDRINGLSTAQRTIQLADKRFYDNIGFQMMGMNTDEYSGPIDVDSSVSISLSVENMIIESANGTKETLIEGGIITDTLIMDTIVQSFELSSDFDMSVSEIKLSAGVFDYNGSSTLKGDLLVGLIIPSLTDSNGNIFNEVIEFNYENSQNIPVSNAIDLAGYTIKLLNSGDSTGSISIISYAMIKDGQSIDFTNDVFFSFGASIRDLGIELVRGDFGRISQEAIDTSINFDIYDGQFQGNIIFSNPSIYVIFSNTVGLDVAIDFSMIGRNNNTGQTAELNNFSQDNTTISGLLNVGDRARIDTFKITNENGLADLFALPPNSMDLALGVTTNPPVVVDGDTLANNNFITDTSSIGASVEVAIPFAGRIENFQLQDTIDFSLDQDIDVEKSSITLNLSIENDFPVTVGMQLIFLNEEDEVLGQLFEDNFADSIFAASTIDEDGVLIAPSLRNNIIELSADKAKMVAEASKVIIRGSLSTPNSSGVNAQNIVFYSDFGFSIKMGVLISVNTDDLLPFMNN